MGILSDNQVKKLVDKREIIIDPYFEVFQGPNCYHCHLGSNFKSINSEFVSLQKSYDPSVGSPKDLYEDFIVKDHYEMKPGEFLLGETFDFF